MRPVLFFVTLLCLFVATCASTAAIAQQSQPRDPKIGYLYPAGGQQGTTFLMLVGGRQITRSSQVLFSGQGIRGRVVQDTLALHINDPRERQLIHQLYLDALQKLDGVSVPPARTDRKEDSTQSGTKETVAPMPTVEDVMKKYPHIDRLRNPTVTDLELVYYYYFSPRLERKPLAEILNRGVLLEITIDSDAEPGDRDFRLLGPAGMTPPARFVVGIHPEVREQEPNSTTSEDSESKDYRWRDAILAPKSIKNRPPLEWPVVINGQIHAGDVDRFQFKANRGQKLVLDVQARHLHPFLADAVPGWFQAVISLFDPDGKKIGEATSHLHNPDPVLSIEISKSGIYSLEIRDSIFRGRDDFVYRVIVAESPIRLPHSLRLAADDLPEKNEVEPNNDFQQAEKLSQPMVVSGVIADANDIDVFSFDGRKGSNVVLDVTARFLDSPLDAMLELFDSSETLIASSDDRADAKGPNIGLQTHHADPYLSVEIPADGRYFVRLYDVTQKGGEAFGYRLRVSPPRGDFSVFCEPSSVVFSDSTPPLKVHLIRKDGFDGDVRLRLVSTSDVQLENGRIASGTDEATVKLIALSRYSGGVREIAMEAVAVIDGKETVRPVVPVDEMEQSFIYHHLVPAKSLTVSKSRTPMSQSVTKSDPLVTELQVSQLQYRGASGNIDYCQAVENKELSGEMSLVLILHGRSGSGSDNVRQLTSPALKPLLSFVRSEGKKTVVIVPQCPADQDWVRGGSSSPLSVVYELVKQKCKDFNVSPKRVYITGVSMGGGACYTLLARTPGEFTKAVVVSAGGRPEEAIRLKGDFYIVHGENDNIIPVDRARTMAEAIRKNRDATVQFISLPNKDHVTAANAAYSEACWRWLFR